ncbi:MAG: DEAD/DEAH box helicase family protein [Bacteroidales bacterium]|nr:DEAD/DEAH box helicase family protein [Bacteroidales bacterium]
MSGNNEISRSQIFTLTQLSEEDVKRLYITPVLENVWNKSLITMEHKITDGKINIKGNITVRETPKKADYILYMNAQFPLAIVEAKSAQYSASHGMQQAKEYCKMMEIPFAYSTNGVEFEEYDFLTGIERTFPLADFPTQDELWKRYLVEVNGGQGLSQNELTLVEQPYYTDQNTFDPRYYQANAVNATLKAIANGQKRLLLVMATGTGKTFTAFQIVYRLIKSGLAKKILYLADRNVLVDQSIEQDFRSLEKVIHKVNYREDIAKGKATYSAYQVYFALYQQLIGENSEAHYSELFAPNYFDLVIVDECHRGSAKDDSQWRCVLDYFTPAYQLGMTATPKETSYISNLSYFGEPLYQYSLNQGIEDGFLAPFKVIKITTNISEGWRPTAGQRDINGNIIEDRIYSNSDFDYKIVIQDRINQVAEEITKYLKATNRMSRTIVFCADEAHAERMRVALANLNNDMMKVNPDYVVRITGSDPYGKSKLKYFLSVSSQYPVIATTSELLSTGADCKLTKLIVLDQMIGSMTQFKQIIGRGTRVREKDGKMSFVVMDFRNVTRLFADEDWDGPIEVDQNYPPSPDGKDKSNSPDEPKLTDPQPPQATVKPIVDSNGCKVQIINKVVSTYDTNGKLLRQESIVDYTKTNVLGEYASLEHFIRDWNAAEKKAVIRKHFADLGIDFEQLKREQNLTDVDDFDLICHIAFDKKPLTRAERANNVKKRDFISKYNESAQKVLNLLLDKYKDEGIYEMENEAIFNTPFVKKTLGGNITKVISYFDGETGFYNAMKQLETALYATA